MPEWTESVWHLYVAQVQNRSALMQQLKEAGVHTLIHYPIPPHLTGAYSKQFKLGQFPVTENIAGKILSLPLWSQMSFSQIDDVVETLQKHV